MNSNAFIRNVFSALAIFDNGGEALLVIADFLAFGFAHTLILTLPVEETILAGNNVGV
mgnify:CR=1 FL=1